VSEPVRKGLLSTDVRQQPQPQSQQRQGQLQHGRVYDVQARLVRQPDEAGARKNDEKFRNFKRPRFLRNILNGGPSWETIQPSSAST